MDATVYKNNKIELDKYGYSTVDNLYTDVEISKILYCIQNTKQDKNSVMKTKDIFAIRQLFTTAPNLKKYIFNSKILQLITTLSSLEYFLTKAIYFDKPSKSNWFVAYHQDLSISVNNKVEIDNYVNWTFKKDQYGVQPPVQILQDTITVRIHLDDTDKNNGALRVIPKSHLRGIIPHKDYNIENEVICDVKKGGAMLMKPLTLHASSKTTNEKQRRVIHLEFCSHKLEKPLQWLEYYNLNEHIQAFG